MVLVLIIIIAMSLGLLVSPLFAGAIFVVGAIAWVLLAVLKGNSTSESPSGGGPEAHTAARMREEGRNARHR